MKLRKSIFVFTLMLWVLVTGSFLCFAERKPEYDRDQVQLLVLLKLLPFVEWPDKEPSDETLNIGVWNNRGFAEILDELIEGLGTERSIQVVDLNESNFDEIVLGLDILYFSDVSDWKRSGNVISDANPNLLVVGSGDAFLDQGGILNFVNKGERVAFEVNNKRAKEAGIIFRSRLLRLAERVVQ